jgi:predicted secreted hydrolase
LLVLAALSARADSPGAPVGSRLDVLRAGSSDQGFARALSPQPFEFPRDHGPHPRYRHEWWYLNGRLRTRSGADFGFELTFFRIAVAPAQFEPAGSRWRAHQFYVAHFAVTDVQRRQFHSAERYARDALDLAGARAVPFDVWLDGWSFGQPTQASADPMIWELHAADASYSLNLTLRALGAPVLNGDRGLSIKSDAPGSASYYYSIPRLSVQGRLGRGAQSLEVSGLAWLDREWGSGALGQQQQGWDWYALQLGDGSALMFYALRDRSGARDVHSAGTWIEADGTTHALDARQVQTQIERYWVSPHGARYPSRFRLQIAALGLDLEVVPVLEDQELDTSPRYWEGAVDVSGSRGGHRLSGQGYVELVGYAGR